MGVVSVIGDSVAGFADSLADGRSGITQWKRPMDSRCYSRSAATSPGSISTRICSGAATATPRRR